MKKIKKNRKAKDTKMTTGRKKRLLRKMVEKEATVSVLQAEIQKIREKIGASMELNEVIDIGLDKKIFSKWQSRIVTLPSKKQLLRKLGTETYIDISTPSKQELSKQKGEEWIKKHCTIDYNQIVGWRNKKESDNGE